MPGQIKGARARVVQLLEAADPPLPAGAVVTGHGWAPEAIEAPHVLVATDTVDAAGVACSSYAVAVTVVLVAPVREPGTGDDAIDDLLELVLPALHQRKGVDVSPAQRGSFRDTWPAYTIPLEVTT